MVWWYPRRESYCCCRFTPLVEGEEMLVYVRYLLFGCGFVVLQYDWESFGHHRNVGVCGVHAVAVFFFNGGTITRQALLVWCVPVPVWAVCVSLEDLRSCYYLLIWTCRDFFISVEKMPSLEDSKNYPVATYFIIWAHRGAIFFFRREGCTRYSIFRLVRDVGYLFISHFTSCRHWGRRRASMNLCDVTLGRL